jgi:uncharacterized protein YcfJ
VTTRTPTTRPAGDISPKVAAASVGAAIGSILIWGFETGTGVDVPTLVEGAVAVLLTFGLGYLVRDTPTD